MLPVAPGANGQPPSPPIDDSNSRTPSSSPFITLARPMPRVLWKCSAMMASGKRLRIASTVRVTTGGVAMPVVSPSEMWRAPPSRYAPTSLSTLSIDTSPSNGQPNAVATAPRNGMPKRRAIAANSVKSASAASSDLLRLVRQCVSEADTKDAIMSTLAAAARSAPRALGTRPVSRTPGRRSISAITSAASASCGTARGDTNEVTSKLRTPALISAFITCALVSVGMNSGSDWKPSRVPTSVTSTKRSESEAGR